MNEEKHNYQKNCGAVAVSWHRSEYTLNAIKCLIKHQVKTNIHYMLIETHWKKQ